ncbi:MAG: T9SS type A sorting domain-containing protein [Flavobacteriales bacterium]|nr:T9SS type A sorting domain-containing protein [Flavobacteriales bacterium]
MKQRTKNMRRPKLPIALIPALLSGMLQPCQAQDSTLALLNGPVHSRSTVVPTTGPISDDGTDRMALEPAGQLMISFTSISTEEVHVEVLNEQGLRVLERTRTDDVGRTLVPLDVDGLANGRYVLRVRQGAATGTRRFLRP